MSTKQLRDIPLSVLDLSPIRLGATAADALRNTLDLAQHVEKWGFNRYWLAEHHGMAGIASAATSVVIGHVAGGTKTIRVGSGGIMLPNHAPLVIAEQFGTLESLYPGRIDLGLGRAPGTDQVTARALRRNLHSTGDEFPEFLAELREYFQPTDPENTRRVRAVPGEGLNVPIWLLGSSGYSAQLAGMLGLPFAFASHFAPDYLMPALNLYRSNFDPSDDLQKPHAMVGVHVIAAETDEEAQYLATTVFQKFVNMSRGTRTQSLPPVKNMDDIWQEHEKIFVQSQLRMTVIGSPQTVKGKLQAILDQTQADELICVSDIYEHADRLRSYEILADVWKS